MLCFLQPFLQKNGFERLGRVLNLLRILRSGAVGLRQHLRGARLLQAVAGPQDPKKIQDAAKAFESILLEKWLEEAQHSFASMPGDDKSEEQDDDAGSDQYRDIGIQALAKQLSDSGGIGIAAMIVRQLTPKAAAQAAQTSNPADSKGFSVSNSKARPLDLEKLKF